MIRTDRHRRAIDPGPPPGAAGGAARVPKQRAERREGPDRRAFSLVEVVISMLIVSILFVAAIGTVSATRASRVTHRDRVRGLQLAQELMAEITQRAYQEPGSSSDTIGAGPGELATGDRSLFDDVDDYDGWSASPPKDRAGNDLPDMTGWTRSVAVTWVDPADTATPGVAADRTKRITVTVERQGRVVAELVALRTAAWQDPAALP